MKKRILAWIALILFIILFVNILFIHLYITESAIVLSLYVLFFIYIKRKKNNQTKLPSQEDLVEPDNPEQACEEEKN